MRPLEHKRVMVVEDEYLLANDLCRALQTDGAEVVGPFPSERTALDSNQLSDIDAAILDLDLQGRPSLELADRLTALKIPFIFASGYGEAGIPERFASVGRWSKPYDAGELAAALPRLFF